MSYIVLVIFIHGHLLISCFILKKDKKKHPVISGDPIVEERRKIEFIFQWRRQVITCKPISKKKSESVKSCEENK